MRRNRPRYREEDVSRTLDLLVLDVVKTLVRSHVEEPAPPVGPVPDDTARHVALTPEDVANPPRPSASHAGPGRDVTAQPASRPRSATLAGTRTRGPMNSAPVGRVPFEEEERLLDQEEESFVTQTADWLRKRSNPDDLLALIWTLVTEADPAEFYRPESPMESTPPNASPETEAGIADTGSGPPSRIDA